MKSRSLIVYIWFVVTLCSFGYELPVLILSSVDRFNPRLFDIMFLIGVILFNTRIFSTCKNSIVSLWGKTLIWMSVCAFATFIVAPRTYGLYSLYYLFRYVEGYLVVRMLFLCKEYLSVSRLELIMIGAGLIVSVFSLLQYFGRIPAQFDYSFDQDIPISGRFMLGPYSSTYFAVAQMIPMCTLFCINRTVRDKRFRLLFIAISLLFVFVGVSCGSRTALFLTISTVLMFFLVLSKHRIVLIGGLAVAAFIIYSIIVATPQPSSSFNELVFEQNSTLARGRELEGDSESSIASRMEMFKSFNYYDYDYNTMMPFLGSGFYVSPKKGSFRVGYGFHNNYLFAFEQMGIVGFILFLLLLFNVLKGSYKSLNDNDVGRIMFTYTLMLCIANVTGQIFWQGFGTCDINTLTVYLMALAVEHSLPYA